MRKPFSGYNNDDQHASNLMRICEPGLDGRVLWLKGIIINNPGSSDRIVKLYDEAEADTPKEPTAAKQRGGGGNNR